MKVIAISIGLVFALVAPGRAADDKDLNGTWTLVSATRSGIRVDAESFRGAKMYLLDGKYMTTIGAVKEEGTFKVDLSATPNTIDMSPDGAKADASRLGVFELDGEKLTICMYESKKRPTDLTSTKENKNNVVVYRRFK